MSLLRVPLGTPYFAFRLVSLTWRDDVKLLAWQVIDRIYYWIPWTIKLSNVIYAFVFKPKCYLWISGNENTRLSPGRQTTFPFCQLHGSSHFATFAWTKTNYENDNILGTYQSVHLIAKDWMTEESEFDPSQGNFFFFSLVTGLSQSLTQRLIQRVTGAISPGVKRPGRKSNELCPSSA